MSDNLVLRKAALEATGWTHLDFGFGDNHLWHRPNCPDTGVRGCSRQCDGCGTIDELPAVESDPGVSEPWMDEFCRTRELRWDLYVTQLGNSYSCAIYSNTGGTTAHVFGETPSEARARAVIKAVRKGRT